MIPKGKLLALVLVFGAVGTLAATGAFTTVEAERTADVDVAGDANALLAIQPTEDPENSSFINQDDTDDSTFEIVLDGNDGNNGVNANATTTAEGIFNITNNGEEDVDVWINTEGGAQDGNSSVNTTFYIDDNQLGSQINETSSDSSVSIDNRINEFNAMIDSDDVVISEDSSSLSEQPDNNAIAVNIESGETVTVSMAIEIEPEAVSSGTLNLDNTDEPILEDITISAVNDEEGDNAIDGGTTTGPGS
ncbi:hypothetical protein [Haloquadratum walsbyi]|uniref:Uncharacterized protein n=1 Tax=Haloquadratum walsbyi (strain DSM 16854 / JCM 12705 / C23) TaxID=768065 RepID=G0LL92_HALWC|nr:hypothetical protein [Haloquadratum walsbyi]CCC40532.1 uncharacterized protein Hqrw_2700 [Haloquadratum walsbyi C23]